MQAFAHLLGLLPVHGDGKGVSRTPLLECLLHLLGGRTARKCPRLHEAYRVQGAGDLDSAQVEGLPKLTLRGPIQQFGRDPTRPDALRLGQPHNSRYDRVGGPEG